MLCRDFHRHLLFGSLPQGLELLEAEFQVDLDPVISEDPHLFDELPDDHLLALHAAPGEHIRPRQHLVVLVPQLIGGLAALVDRCLCLSDRTIQLIQCGLGFKDQLVQNILVPGAFALNCLVDLALVDLQFLCFLCPLVLQLGQHRPLLGQALLQLMGHQLLL